MVRHCVMNLSFLSTIGSSNSCTCWLCKFESYYGLLNLTQCLSHDIEIETNCALISFVVEQLLGHQKIILTFFVEHLFQYHGILVIKCDSVYPAIIKCFNLST